MEPVVGLLDGMVWAPLCFITLPVLLLVVGGVMIARRASMGAVERELRPPDAPVGWHPDPTGEHTLRYWNGFAWTQSVSDGDEIPEAPL